MEDIEHLGPNQRHILQLLTKNKNMTCSELATEIYGKPIKPGDYQYTAINRALQVMYRRGLLGKSEFEIKWSTKKKKPKRRKQQMNKTRIEWTSYSWNPITGCDHGCWYCYANKLFTRFHRSFRPEFHPERLTEIHKPLKPSKIFVCSVSDLFAPWTKPEWRNAVLAEIDLYNMTRPLKERHIFQLLTKNPELIPDIEFPENVWVGTTVTTENGDIRNIEAIKKVRGNRFVSFEPLLGKVDFTQVDLEGVDWVIVGKLTGSRKIKLNPEWVQDIVGEANRVGLPVFLKNNLRDTYGVENPMVQEFPSFSIG